VRAVVFAGEGKVRVDEIPDAHVVEEDDAVVRITRSAICGSDLHLLDGKTPGMRVGSVIGHEFVGTILEAPSGFEEGQRVLGSFLIACGTCSHCSARRFNLCSSRRALGLGTLTGDLDGAQADLVRVPNAQLNLKPLDGALAALGDEAALFSGDVLTTGFYGASLAGAGKGDLVCVLGAGPIGIFTAQAALASGARVVLLDIDPHRVEAARQLGLDAHVSGEAPHETLTSAAGSLADAVVEAVGSIAAFKTSMRLARDGGRVVVLGVYGAERVDLSMGMAWIRGLDIVFSGMANIHAHWDEALAATMQGQVEPTGIITHRLPLERAEEGYELFASREATKVVFEL
jgi:threonine dehydrogenase-like Zn-dependent dehydrogenase